MYVCVHVYLRSLGTRVTKSMSYLVGDGNQIQVLWKSSKGS